MIPVHKSDVLQRRRGEGQRHTDSGGMVTSMHWWITDRKSRSLEGISGNRWEDHSSMTMKHIPSVGTSTVSRTAVFWMM